jgi:TAG lipase/steryl ester hydrolase/phospholipase A2/LPA acyltransferase
MLINGNLRLKRSLRQAGSYEEWAAAAAEYDKNNGLDRWRQKDTTKQYDHVAIRLRLDRLRSLKARHDTRGLFYTLNEGIHGNMGGMGRAGLYGHALSGTKRLIEDYIEEIVDTLEMLADDDSGEFGEEEMRDFFRRGSHCFGRSAFMMSGSGSLLFFHVGVIRALAAADLLPTILSGSSGGAIIGSVVSTHTNEELAELMRPEYFLDKIPKDSKALTVAPVAELQASIEQFIPDLTFQQAFDKTGRAMNVSIAPAETHQTSRLLNATTSPSVLIRSAVMASAAVPGIFPPVTLQALDSHGDRKNYLPSRKWVDGSVSDDLPAKRLARLYGVNHYVVSQTNPHVIPFVSDGHRKQNAMGILTEAGRRSTREWFNALTIIAGKADKRSGVLTQGTSLLRSIINQDYVGDINILPDYKFFNPLKLLTFPGEKQMRRLIDSGERCTWPKLEMIRLQTRISRKLDEIMAQHKNWV